MDADKLRFIEEVTANADTVPERVLAEILTRNAEAEYLRLKCGLAGATDRASGCKRAGLQAPAGHPRWPHDEFASPCRRPQGPGQLPALSCWAFAGTT
ncbi:unnamed protein product [Urochloa humidicola]